jgi:hypothetical protein
MAGVPHGLDVAAAGRRQGAAGGQLAAWCAGGGRACRGRTDRLAAAHALGLRPVYIECTSVRQDHTTCGSAG